MFAGKKFLDQIKLLAKLADFLAKTKAIEFVSQRKEARGLEPDDGCLRRDFATEGGEHAFTLMARLFDHAGGEIGAATAQRAVRFGVTRRRFRDSDLIARMFEHGGGGLGDLGIEMMAESVDEQNDFAAWGHPT